MDSYDLIQQYILNVYISYNRTMSQIYQADLENILIKQWNTLTSYTFQYTYSGQTIM